jgi:Zn-dependent metalloprotease
MEAVKDFTKQKIGGSDGNSIFPKDLINNIKSERLSDSFGSSDNKQHFFFVQTLNGVPIYGSSLAVHIKNGNEIYSTSGNLALSSKFTKKLLSDEKAKEIALTAAKKEKPDQKLAVYSIKKYYFNNSIMELSSDPVNHSTAAIIINSPSDIFAYITLFIVDLENGKILYTQNQLQDALDRTIKDCNLSSSASCSVARREGGVPASVSDVNSAYDMLGRVYNFYLSKFLRDSYDGAGAPYVARVRDRSVGCPNAMWSSDYQLMAFCPELVVDDVAWHELTHALTSKTAKLIYEKQAGALNEAVSDIFGTFSDNNWTMGETIPPSAGLPVPLRSLIDPSSRSQPDRLFASNYYCKGTGPGERCIPPGLPGQNDSCGVHYNSGVINKTFYLMTDGGSFNGCTISGIGRDRSGAIMYSALTHYLTSNSNFYDFYSAVQQACGDLYGATSSICAEVKKAAEATELDQQTPGSQRAPVCDGTTAKPATCANTPSSSPIPTLVSPTVTTVPGVTITPTVTLTPLPTVLFPTPTPTLGVFKTRGTPTPTPDQYYSCVPDPKCINNGKSIQLCPLVCTPR